MEYLFWKFEKHIALSEKKRPLRKADYHWKLWKRSQQPLLFIFQRCRFSTFFQFWTHLDSCKWKVGYWEVIRSGGTMLSKSEFSGKVQTVRLSCKMPVCIFTYTCYRPSVCLPHRVRPRFFDQVGHQTTKASIENQYFSLNNIIVRLTNIRSRKFH